jgi:hypothetical protein
MPAYNPQPFVRVNGVSWSGDTLDNVSITNGRSNVNEQARTGYARFTIITNENQTSPDFAIDEVVTLGVLDTSSAEKVLFQGRISDITTSLGAFGSTGYLTQTEVTAVGLLAIANRTLVGAGGYPQELDGVRVANIFDEVLALDYPAYENYYDDNQVLPLRTNLCRNPNMEGSGFYNIGNSSIAFVTDWAQFGTQSLRVRPSAASSDSFAGILLNATTGTNLVTIIEPNKRYRISGYVHVPTALTGSLSGSSRRIVVFYQVSGGAFQAFSSTQGANISGTTTRVQVDFTMPNNTTNVIVRLYNGATNSATNDVLWDGILIEETTTLNDYFDGNSPNQPVYWTGAPNASTSIRGGDAGSYVVAGDQTWATLDPYLGTFDQGDYEIIAYSGGATNAYSLASQVANSAGGVIYETADGRVAYQEAELRTDKTDFLEIPANVILASGLQTTESLGDIANDITIGYGSSLSVNGIDQNSIDTYGRLAASVSTVLADLTSANTLLDYYLNTKSTPRKMFTQLTLGVHLDTMENALRDDLLDVQMSTGLTTNVLPPSIYPDRFSGFVEGYTWTITRNTMFLTLIVSDYLMSVRAENWSQVDPAEAWNTVSATLEWQEARIIA